MLGFAYISYVSTMVIFNSVKRLVPEVFLRIMSSRSQVDVKFVLKWWKVGKYFEVQKLETDIRSHPKYQ
jgi:hypothetical protein